jgi:hypothetical protein
MSHVASLSGMRVLLVLLLLIASAAADEVAVDLEGGQFCCRLP